MSQTKEKSKLQKINLDKFILIRDAEVASYINEKGLISFVPANTPRLNWLSNPNFTVNSKHKFLGLLIEFASTNRLIHSTNLTHKSWIDFHHIARVAENEVLSPEGTSGNNKVISIIDLPRNDFHLIKQRVVNGSRKDRTVSIFVKRVENAGTKDFAIWGLHGLQIAVFSRKDWSLISGKATNTNVEFYPNGWVRLSATYNAINDDIYFGTSEGGKSTYIGENQKQFYLYGPQLEDLSEVTSYIPTNEETRARGGEIAYVNETYYQGELSQKVRHINLSNEVNNLTELNQNQIDIWLNNDSEIYEQIADTLNKNVDERDIAYYKIYLRLHKNQVDYIVNLATILVKKGLLEIVIDCWENAFKNNQKYIEVYHKLAIYLAVENSVAQAINCLEKSYIKIDSKENIFGKIWKGLNQLDTLDSFSVDYSQNFPLEEVKDYFKQTGQYTIVKINNLNDHSRRIIEQTGLSLANLHLMRQDSIALENIYINSLSKKGNFKLSEVARKRKNFSWEPLNETRDFQQSIIETGYMYSICPISGKPIKSNQSFCFYYQNNQGILLSFYRFVGYEVFYWIVGGWDNGKMALYFPKHDLVIDMCNILWRKNIDFKILIDDLKSYAVSNWSAFKSYVSNQTPKQIAAIVGSGVNLGHYFWNELGGIQYLFEVGILDKVDKFLIAPHNRLELCDVFPEVPKEKLVYDKCDFDNIFKNIIENNYFSVKVTESYIRKNLSSRVYSTTLNQCSKLFLEKVAESQNYFPLLWLNLRQHNKSWTDQIQGNANIITHLFQKYPNIAIIFDGMPDTEEIMEEIKSLIPPQIKTYNALNCTMNETITWAYAIDVYIAVIGSGLTFLTWLANKPGVAHGNRAHLAQKIFWKEVREDSIIPEFIEDKYIIDQTNVSGIYQNYDCDWKIILNKLTKIIEKLQVKSNQDKSLSNSSKYLEFLQQNQQKLQQVKKYIKNSK